MSTSPYSLSGQVGSRFTPTGLFQAFDASDYLG